VIDVDDPRWRALSCGELAEDQKATLYEEAMASPEGQALWELFRPFDEEERKRIFQRVRAVLQARRGRPE
jgi:hypothetical protein